MYFCAYYTSVQVSLERFLAIASSTALSCFSSSSRRVDFLALAADEDEFDLLELFDAPSVDALPLPDAGGDRFFAAAASTEERKNEKNECPIHYIYCK